MMGLQRTLATLDRASVADAYQSSDPFRHMIIDDFFERADALAMHEAFPSFSVAERIKARLFSSRVYGPPAGNAFAATFSALASRTFVAKLSKLTKIEPLAMDETLSGAGVHVGLPGSASPVHADHNTHPAAPWLYRRLNLLVYLNPNWNCAWQANLLLYDRGGNRKVLEIEPRFNRAVLMEVSDSAFHGYHAMRLPRGQSRQVLAAYYFSPTRSMNQAAEPHSTTFSNPKDVRLVERIILRVRRSLVYRFKTLMPRPSPTD